MEFVRAYDISQDDRFFDIYAVSDGGYIMCGKANYAGRFRRNDMIVVRVDSEGELIWSETYGDGFLDYSAKSIVETDNGEFFSGGEAYNGDNRSQQFMATLLNNDGEVEWQRDYGESSCYAVIELKSGEFMLAGITGDTAQLIKIDNDGDVIWQETYQHNENRLFNSMRETEGGVVASGNRAVWVIKVDEDDGGIIWSEDHNANIVGSCEMTSTVDGGFAVALYNSGGNGNNYGLFKVNDEGQAIWERNYENEDGNRQYAESLTRLKRQTLH